MRQSALLAGESTSFAIEPGEDELTNPGVFGKALATWLAEQLRNGGSRSGAVIAEDFGWCIPVESKPHRLYVACASAQEIPDTWRVFVFAEVGLLSRLLGKDQSAPPVASLFCSVKQIRA